MVKNIAEKELDERAMEEESLEEVQTDDERDRAYEPDPAARAGMEDEKEDELTSDLELHQLYDMTEDVAESAKLKRAEANFARRQTEDSF